MPSTLVNPFEALHEFPDERAIDSRPDVLTFTTALLDEPVTLAGRVVAHLEVASEGPSMHLHVKLVDVHEDGRAHALLFGQQVVESAGREGLGRGLPRPHGLPLAQGHRLRLQVASSDFPVFLPHPGSAENPWDATATRTNLQTLTAGGETPSYLSLTVLRGER